MHVLMPLVAALTMTATVSPADAADWWMISTLPGEEQAAFADLETLRRENDGVSLQVLRIDEQGQPTQKEEHVSCTGNPVAGSISVRRFACASDEQRDSVGMILIGMSPAEVARIYYNSQRNARPQG